MRLLRRGYPGQEEEEKEEAKSAVLSRWNLLGRPAFAHLSGHQVDFILISSGRIQRIDHFLFIAQVQKT